MKTLLNFTFILGVVGFLSAQDLRKNEVPQIHQDNFKAHFPDARDVEWEKQNEYYKVEFEEGPLDRDIWYTIDGEIHKRELEMKSSDLPKPVKKQLAEKYKDFRVDDCELITENSEEFYKIELESRDQEKVVQIKENGEILKEWDDN